METGKRPQTNEQRQTQVITRLTNENAKLRQETIDHDKKVNHLEKLLEKALLRIEELEKMVFGKKKKKEKENNEDNDHNNKPKDNSRSKRNTSSYQRPIPDKEDITDTKEYKIDHCPDCKNQLTRLKTVIRYPVGDFTKSHRRHYPDERMV